jgi:hypothetical protein
MARRKFAPQQIRAPKAAIDKKGVRIAAERPTKHVCSRCGKVTTAPKGNFMASQSDLFYHNAGYMTICRDCVGELYDNYLRSYDGNEKAAAKRICMMFDIYWNEEFFENCLKTANGIPTIFPYINKTNLTSLAGRTFDTTIKENPYTTIFDLPEPEEPEVEDDDDEDVSLQFGGFIATKEIQDFWGYGFELALYADLDRRYKQWQAQYDEDGMTVSQQAIVKQICIAEATVARDTILGKDIAKTQGVLNNLYGSAGLKPKQQETQNSDAGVMPLGVAIRYWENTHPVPQPDEELADVDGLKRYIKTWYAGHMADSLALKDVEIPEYAEEIEQYTVTPPEFDDTQPQSAAYEAVFGKKVVE